MEAQIPCAFDTLFTKHVPHILEKIFLSLDYESFKSCCQASNAWKKVLTSESFQSKAVWCRICKKVFSKASQLRLHVNIHDQHQQLPIGFYAEMEKLGTNLNEIETTDDRSTLNNMQQMAEVLYKKDPSRLPHILYVLSCM